MVRLTGTINQLNKRKILVVGDLILDTYTIGKARRISPEAPVAVVQVSREEQRPGGAGNVVLNLLSLGADVTILGRIGNDNAGSRLKKSLEDEGCDITGLFSQQQFNTPVKNRIIAENQQIVRVDYEQVTSLDPYVEQQMIDKLPTLLQDVAAVAISDYGKGSLSTTLLSSVIDHALACGIAVITDPKGNDFTKYRRTTIIKPNLSEAYAAANLLPGDNLDLAAKRILETVEAEMLMVTRSEAGISLYHRNGTRDDFPVHVKEIKDVTGAGDTVLAMLTYAIANGLSMAEAAQLSNVAAGIAIERFGCARVSLSDLARRLLESDTSNKVFDQQHLFALQQALQDSEYLLLGISSLQGMSSAIFSAIHQLSKRFPDTDLVVYLYDEEPNENFITLLAALHAVTFIIVNADNLNDLCEAVKPKEIYAVVDNECYAKSSVADLLLV